MCALPAGVDSSRRVRAEDDQNGEDIHNPCEDIIKAMRIAYMRLKSAPRTAYDPHAPPSRGSPAGRRAAIEQRAPDFGTITFRHYRA
eukprot:6200773-Pleurochrysis_carterae.AAC.2